MILSGSFSVRNLVGPGNFLAFQIFIQKNLAVRTFVRNFFGFFNFQTGKNPAGELSIPKFLRFSKFAPKIFRPGKFRGQKKFRFSDSMAYTLVEDLRRGSELVAELTPFFPTFAPTFFGFFNFRPEKFWILEISNQKKSGQKNFVAKKIRAYELSRQNFLAGKNFGPPGHNAIGRKNFWGICKLRRQHPPLNGVLPTFTMIVRKFLGAKVCTPLNFVARKISRRKKHMSIW